MSVLERLENVDLKKIGVFDIHRLKRTLCRIFLGFFVNFILKPIFIVVLELSMGKIFSVVFRHFWDPK